MGEENTHTHGAVICDYCSKPAVQITGATIYPHRPDLTTGLPGNSLNSSNLVIPVTLEAKEVQP